MARVVIVRVVCVRCESQSAFPALEYPLRALSPLPSARTEVHLASLPSSELPTANSQDETRTAQMTHSMKEKSARRENETMWLRFCSHQACTRVSSLRREAGRPMSASLGGEREEGTGRTMWASRLDGMVATQSYLIRL